VRRFNRLCRAPARQLGGSGDDRSWTAAFRRNIHAAALTGERSSADAQSVTGNHSHDQRHDADHASAADQDRLQLAPARQKINVRPALRWPLAEALRPVTPTATHNQKTSDTPGCLLSLTKNEAAKKAILGQIRNHRFFSSSDAA
jgi:hypothetical protein